MKKLLITVIFLVTAAQASFGQFTITQPIFRGNRTSAPPTCASNVGTWYYNQTTKSFNYCAADNTWSVFAGAGGEPIITAGTTAQYWRGDKTWQTLNQAAVAGLTTASTPTFAGAYLTGSIGAGTLTPRRKGDFLDTTNPQLRLTNIDNSVYTDLQTDASGYFLIAPSGNRVVIDGRFLQTDSGSITNTRAGIAALNSNSSGIANSAFGLSALESNTTGTYNTAAGYEALNVNTGGLWNTAIGTRVLNSNINGSYNAALGMYAGRYSTGSHNVILGYFAGLNFSTGDYNIIIGDQNDVPNGNYQLNIGGAIKGDLSTGKIWFNKLKLMNLAVYADNAAATAGGLATNEVYRTSTGQLMIVY